MFSSIFAANTYVQETSIKSYLNSAFYYWLYVLFCRKCRLGEARSLIHLYLSCHNPKVVVFTAWLVNTTRSFMIDSSKSLVKICICFVPETILYTQYYQTVCGEIKIKAVTEKITYYNRTMMKRKQNKHS